MFETLLILNICATLFMTGLIWFVQVVHYPGFLQVKGRDAFDSYHRFHMPATGYVVMLPMMLELGSSLALVTAFDRLWQLNAAGLVLVIGVWISTGLLQIPYHFRLGTAPTERVKQRLVASNWIRTLLWSCKALLGGFILFRLITS